MVVFVHIFVVFKLFFSFDCYGQKNTVLCWRTVLRVSFLLLSLIIVFINDSFLIFGVSWGFSFLIPHFIHLCSSSFAIMNLMICQCIYILKQPSSIGIEFPSLLNFITFYTDFFLCR